MIGNMGGWSLLIILAVILLLFGAAKLPALAKSVGQSARVFKGEMKAMKEENASETPEGSSDAASGTAPSVSADTDKPDSTA